jgi:NAD(P)-dependent dehydrogenase (short-subunit alcohol dehydrogenase family)
MMTRGLALELEGDGILVNAIAPATIDTAANRAAMPGADRTRWARPEDIAPVIAWMLSPRNVLVSGAIIPV